MSKPQLIIKEKLLLLCERAEIAQFVRAYIEYLQTQGVRLPSYQLLNFRSMDRLNALAQRLLSIEGADKVRSVVFFTDAARDLETRRNCLDTIRGSAYFAKIFYCSHFFFPGRLQGKRWRNGYLEDMLLETLRPETAVSGEFINLYNVSQEYVDSVNNCRGRGMELSNRSRYVLYAYLAATEKYAGLSLGEAARQGAFALDSERYSCLRKCLEKLGKEKKKADTDAIFC